MALMSLSDPAKLHSPLDGWVTIKLGEHASFKTGPFGTALHQSDYEDGGVPIINPTQIVKGKLLGTSSMAVSEKTAISLLAFRLSFGDIVIGRRGEMGRCALVNAEHDGFICGTDSMIIRVNSTLNASLLQRLLSSTQVVSTLEKTSDGLTMSSLNQKTLKSLSLTIPASIIEQDAIADALSDADAYIESLEQLLSKKRDIKQGVMLELLRGKKRLPGFKRDWKSSRLGNLAALSSGGTPPSSVAEFYDGSIPWVSIADITKRGKYIYSTDRFLSDSGLANSAAQMFPAGTVLYAMYASIGECSIAKVATSTSQAILGIRVGPLLNNEFLFYLLSLMRSSVRALGQQGTQSNLNAGIVRSFEFLHPPTVEEQSAIARVLSDIDAEILELELKRDKATAVKQGMMQELLTGRTRLL